MTRTREGVFTLLLVVLCVWVFSFPDGCFVDFDARVAVLHQESSIRAGGLAVVGNFGFHTLLDGEGARRRC